MKYLPGIIKIQMFINNLLIWQFCFVWFFENYEIFKIWLIILSHLVHFRLDNRIWIASIFYNKFSKYLITEHDNIMQFANAKITSSLQLKHVPCTYLHSFFTCMFLKSTLLRISIKMLHSWMNVIFAKTADIDIGTFFFSPKLYVTDHNVNIFIV